jgi:quinoprotein glucose dehydrogenase
VTSDYFKEFKNISPSWASNASFKTIHNQKEIEHFPEFHSGENHPNGSSAFLFASESYNSAVTQNPHNQYSVLKMDIIHTSVISLFGLLALNLHAASNDWQSYGADRSSSQYSPLTQIHRGNVGQLKLAWEYKSEPLKKKMRSQIQCNPLVIDGVLYGSSPGLTIFALDASTGKEHWRFNPFKGSNPVGVNRGLVFWGKDAKSRILFTASHWLYALDSKTGTLIPNFGTNGRVDLRKHLRADAEKSFILSNTPGVVYGNLLILGTRVSEGPGPSAPGYIRAYNVETGNLAWVFHTIPHPGEMGYDTWPTDAWKTIGGANAWSGLAIDEKRGWVFCPTGSPAFDFWGGNRKGENLFGNCLLVLDAKTGDRIWHYQLVHHDLWDRDLPATPNLIELTIDGQKVPAVAQITKSGHVFLFHRENGVPVFPIEELPFPPSDLKNEEAWPIQPIPTSPPPFARQYFSSNDVTQLSPETHALMSSKLKSVRSGGQFVPPSTQGTVIFPGFDGGGEWGGAAWDPGTEWLFVNANEMPWILTMVAADKDPAFDGKVNGKFLYTRLCATCHGIDKLGDPQKTYPPIAQIGKKMNKEQIIDQMSLGKGLMPAFGFLTQSEKSAIANFLLGNQQPEETDIPSNTSNASSKSSNNNTAYTHTGYNRFLDKNGYPAIKPPWGTLNAIDLKEGRIVWQVTLGAFEDLIARGISPTGTENYGGPAVTAGGLVFIGASKDEKFRAFDKFTGEILWERKLPAGGYATPSIYAVNGKQYIVIACGGGKMNTKSGVSYVAFCLQN